VIVTFEDVPEKSRQSAEMAIGALIERSFPSPRGLAIAQQLTMQTARLPSHREVREEAGRGFA
jgi:hypothetical protein